MTTRISALQKLTLLDYPDNTACTIFLKGCNLRCPFCHNSRLVTTIEQSYITVEEILAFLKKRRGILEGVCITGGEPLLDDQCETLMTSIKELGYKIKLDTNGFFPDRLNNILHKKLADYVAVDIKNSKDLYGKTVGIPDIDLAPLNATMQILAQGNVDYEYRTTVVCPLHTTQSLVQLAQWIKGCPHYYLQQFVDSGELIAPNGLSAYSQQQMHDMLKAVQQIIPQAQLRGID